MDTLPIFLFFAMIYYLLSQGNKQTQTNLKLQILLKFSNIKEKVSKYQIVS